MATCPACQREFSDNQPICSHCGASAENSLDAGKPVEKVANRAGRHTLEYLGFGLAFLGGAMVYLINPNIPGGNQKALALTMEMGLAGLGLALYAVARGWGSVWSLLALIPVLGPFLGLVGLTMLSKRAPKNLCCPSPWVGFMIFLVVLVSFQIYSWNYEAKAVQSEARTTLGAIFVAEQAYYQEHKRYGTFKEIGLEITGSSSRYTYRIDRSDRFGAVIPPTRYDLKSSPNNTKVSAGFSATGFTATATGNIDDDPTIDQWHVNDAKCCLTKADVDDVMN